RALFNMVGGFVSIFDTINHTWFSWRVDILIKLRCGRCLVWDFFWRTDGYTKTRTLGQRAADPLPLIILKKDGPSSNHSSIVAYWLGIASRLWRLGAGTNQGEVANCQ